MILTNNGLSFNYSPDYLLRIGFINEMTKLFGVLRVSFAEEEFMRIYGESFFTDTFAIELCIKVIADTRAEEEKNMCSSEDFIMVSGVAINFTFDDKIGCFVRKHATDRDKNLIYRAQSIHKPYRIRKNDKSLNKDKLSRGDYGPARRKDPYSEVLYNVIYSIYKRTIDDDIDARAAARLDCIAISLAFDSDVDLRFADFYYGALSLNDTIKVYIGVDANLKDQFVTALKDIYNHNRFERYYGHTPIEVGENV